MPSEAIIAAYRETGSVWKAAKQLGLSGQTVHERLRALGYPLAGQQWNDEELAELRDLTAAGVPIGEIAQRLARSYAGVASKANELGLRSQRQRERRLPRGAGFDKASTAKHVAALERSPLSVTKYARSVGLHVDSLVTALQRHFPDRWRAYLETHSELPRRECAYCGGVFVPANGKQQYCDRRCGEDARRDAAYYDGQRRTTIGLRDGICQCCGRKPSKGLSSHHVLGKDHDPENAWLVALCPGCHKVVGQLAAAASADDPIMWQSLISLVWLRRHGGEQPQELYVEVIIESEPDELDEPSAMTLFPRRQ